MTRLTQRFCFLASVAIVAIAMSSQAFAMSVDEPGKDTGTSTEKKDEKDAKSAADGKTPGTKPADAKPADAKPADAKPADKKSDLDFRNGYKRAYEAVYSREDYAGAIVILTALGRDHHPDVANLIGFASRKLGRTEDAKVWYEKALAADPNHSRTWQYYGMWHLERGDRVKAERHLERIRMICGQDCEEYTSLRDALNGSISY